jgi:hypothetical protein
MLAEHAALFNGAFDSAGQRASYKAAAQEHFR